MRILICLLFFGTASAANHTNDGWITLFDGSSLHGWLASESKNTFQLHDGILVVKGDRSHLFYVGDVNGGKFRNFELKIDVKTEHNANSGIYLHTAYQETGWPEKGFEIQINNADKDPRKTGSLYGVSDLTESPIRTGEWFTTHVIVQGKKITVKIDDRTVVEWEQPDDWSGTSEFPQRKIDAGTFALQGHDPDSTVYYRNIRVKNR